MFVMYRLNNVFNDSDVEIGSTIVGCYFCFYIAQIYFDISAVLATVICGLYVSKYRNCISPDVQGSMKSIWTMISFLLNTLIFIIAGVIVCKQFIALQINGIDVGYLFLTYTVITIARLLAVILFKPLFYKFEQLDLTWSEVLLVTCMYILLYIIFILNILYISLKTKN